MKRALVLGGGGLVGMAYHAGALKALEEAGIDPRAHDLIVGTSAGSIMASYLRSGWTASDFYDYAHGRHPDSSADPVEHEAEVRRIFVPLATSRVDRVRRSVGSFFTVASSRGYWLGGRRGHVPLAYLRRAFPSGIYSTEQTRVRLHEELPEKWPADETYICAADVYSGKRVAFGSAGAPDATLPAAVLASCAIPGVFPPVRVGGRHYVDGGVVSATSLDLAAAAGCESILCVAPLGFRSEGGSPLADPAVWWPAALRSLFARALRREVLAARAGGIDVFVVRPWLQELKTHGTNAMRHHDRVAVADSAREGTLRLLEANLGHPALQPVVRAQTEEGAESDRLDDRVAFRRTPVRAEGGDHGRRR